ncbi:uncharacterized protein LOC112508945 [Cynara cardunculus var. scolymus]|uniref:uncharacterized protein LOC112508945 n=1 Tax=Cynara cardunculus var. scolymus TaxID=59895 RepID=UPI000D627C72|nr:uncharacterized protein LOC112508945 [Cynara cardunculus var. scolymus]
MASNSEAYVQAAIPKFECYYDYRVMLMENFLRSKEYWSLIEEGIPTVANGKALTEVQKKIIDDQKLKDLKVKNHLFQYIDHTIMETILSRYMTKDIWDPMKQKFQGSTGVKHAQLQSLRRGFEVLQMKEGEQWNQYFSRTLSIANNMKTHKEKMKQMIIIEKIFKSMTSKSNYVVYSIEECNNLETLTIYELQSSLVDVTIISTVESC